MCYKRIMQYAGGGAENCPPPPAQSLRMPIDWMLLGMYIWIQSTADTDMYLLHADISTAKY